jgi:DNA-binding transcriptional MerR regulator
MFNLLEACDLSGVNVVTLRSWIAARLVTPHHVGHSGPGSGYRFTAMQVVALGVVKQLQNTKRGCRPEYIPTVIEAFTKEGAEYELMAYFVEGKTRYVGVMDGDVILCYADSISDGVDVKRVYSRVINAAVERDVLVLNSEHRK